MIDCLQVSSFLISSYLIDCIIITYIDYSCVVMKTVFLQPGSIKPIKPKTQLNPQKHKVLSTNVKNMDGDSILRISDIISDNKFRQSANIFYIKFNDRQGKFNKNVLNETNQKNDSVLQMKKTKIAGYLPQIVTNQTKQIKHFSGKPKLQNQSMQYDRIQQQQQLEINGNNFSNLKPKANEINKDLDIYKRTRYLFKKQSLNTQLQFFRAYNRFQKSRTFQTPHKFNTELYGVQKTFYQRKKPASIQRRSLSVRQKDSLHLDINANNSTNIDKLRQLSLYSKQGKNIFKQRYLHQNHNKKNKQELFTPWGINSDDHQHDHLFKKQL